MTPDTIQVEVSQNLIKELFQTAGIAAPENLSNEDIITLIKAVKTLQNKDTLPPSTEDINITQEPKTSSVLVVDDLGLVVYQLSLLLTKSGYNVMLARSAPEAFSIFEERGPFDYVLMDLFMPNKEDGLSLLSNIKTLINADNLGTKVIVMSATKDLEAIDEVITLGADSFLEKGQNWKSDLIETIQSL
ncbi:MAG: response regulator [Vampirovibrionia bacterium]